MENTITVPKDLWKKIISMYDLDISELEINAEINALKPIYPNLSENNLFFVYVKNKLGSQLLKMSEEHTDLLAWVDIVERLDNKDWYMFTFQEIDDFMLYMEFRDKLNIDKKLQNFFELNCPDYVMHG